MEDQIEFFHLKLSKISTFRDFFCQTLLAKRGKIGR